MGSLTPNKTYVYERVDDVIYAREEGQLERRVIGWDYKYAKSSAPNSINWVDVFERANSNPSLQTALNNVILIYNIIKDDK